MKERLHGLVAEGLQSLFGVSDMSFVIEHPKELAHGDYATNAAMVAGNPSAGSGQGSPKEIAEKLITYLNEHKGDLIEQVSVAGPGFINFALKPGYFFDTMRTIPEKNAEWGSNDLYKGQKILVEHSSPNLFKPFHIGHLMNNTVGESITRIARATGADVTTISFPSDKSLGVAKAIFILLEKYGADIEGNASVVALGEAYVEGVKRYDTDESIHDRVKEIADNLFAEKESVELDVFNKCKAINMIYFAAVVAGLGSKFDSYIYESEAGVVGKDIVLQNTPRVFTESEGAIVYIPDESKKSLHTAVFINSQGNPTYEAKDIGLLDLKFKQHKPDLSLFVTDNEQVSHFAVVLDAAEKIEKAWFEKSRHIHHGRMSFKGSKMSSRLGGVPLVEDILAAVTDEVKEKNADITADAAKAIGIAALKFGILRTAVGKDTNFDPDTSLSFEGDSGPYLQYTAVRAAAVLAKASGANLHPSFENAPPTVSDLQRLVIRFPDIVERAATEWAPHHIVGYLVELAQAFNSWYGNTKIIDATDTQTPYRLALTQAVSQTIRNGLYLLGIKIPDKM